MIVGTSTGSLIAFALVGGNAIKNSNGEIQREPMPVKEVIQMFKKMTPRIFQQNFAKRFVNRISKSILGAPVAKYGSEGLKSGLQETYEDATLASFKTSDCVAGKRLFLVLVKTLQVIYNNY